MSSWFPRELPNPTAVSNQKLKEIPLPVLFSVYVCVGWRLGGILIRVTLAGFLNYQRKKIVYMSYLEFYVNQAVFRDEIHFLSLHQHM